MKDFNAPVFQGILSTSKKDKFRFHMPGHKGKTLDIYKELSKNLLSLDFTEINGTDDLYNSEDILKEGIELLTKDRKSKYSFFLTNGTTVGILAAILALTNREDSILISKDCHKSVYNGIELNNLNPIVLENKIDDSGLVYPIDENIFLKTLKKNEDIKMVVLSRPNYYGLCGNIENLSKYCNKNNIILLIDEAHGSHFPYSESLPSTAMELGADISVNSFHKTLPAFTQASVINFGYNLSEYNITRVLSMIEKLQTSSPSYLLMASIDIAREYMSSCGKKNLPKLQNYIDDFYNSIKNLDWINFPTIKNNNLEMDYTRIILETSVPAIYVQKFLEENNIFIEMISKNILVLISTTEDCEEDFIYLADILKKFNPNEKLIDTSYNSKKEKNKLSRESLIPLENSAGKTINENIIIYPPGTIYLRKGDTITEDNIKYIKDLLKSGINVYTDFNKNINFLYIALD